MSGGSDFTFVDSERLIRFGSGALADAPRLFGERGFEGYALLTTERAAGDAPSSFADNADVVIHVPHEVVEKASAKIRGEVGGRPIVALGGGRVIDSAKGLGGADDVPVAAVPTTLSGAPFSRIHRLPEGAEGQLVRPSLVIADPELMASAPLPGLAASAMNALAHATESLYVPLRNPIAEIAALRAAALFSSALEPDEPVRSDLALAATLGSWAMGTTGYAFHHPVCQTLVRNPGTPHAETNAVMLPHSIAFARARAPEQIAKLEEALGRDVRELTRRAGPTTLGELGVREEHVEPVVQAVKDRRELENTPGGRPTEAELRELVRGAL